MLRAPAGGNQNRTRACKGGSRHASPWAIPLDCSCGLGARVQPMSSMASSRMPRFGVGSSRTRATASSGPRFNMLSGVSHEHVHSPGPGIVGWPKARAEAPDCAVIPAAASAMRSRLALAKVPSEVMVWLASGSISTGF